MERFVAVETYHKFQPAVDHKFQPAVDHKFQPAVDHKFQPAVDHKFLSAVDDKFLSTVDDKFLSTVDHKFQSALYKPSNALLQVFLQERVNFRSQYSSVTLGKGHGGLYKVLTKEERKK